MKKVCFVINGTGYSGAEIVLNRYLSKNNYINPYFIILFKNNDVERIYKKKYGKEKVICLNFAYNIYNKKIIRALISIYSKLISFKLKNTINLIKPDVIYINNTLEGILCSEYIKNSNIKSILHIHDMRETYRKIHYKYIIEKNFKYYNKIITVSKATKDSWGNIDMDYIYNGLDDEYFKFNNISTQIRNIAFIGSLTFRKGADIFINQIEWILENTILDIYIVYKSFDKKILNLLDKHRNNERVHILTNKNEKEMQKIYEKLNLLIVPSRLDPLPTVIMEAQARGILVLGNSVSGIPEMIPINDFVFDMNLDGEIKRKIIRLLNMNEHEIINCKRYVYKYTYENFKNNIKKEYINNIVLN